ncbi:MAG: sulfotransferase [Actinomycetota bacterium]|nr:sulfotransferase [Actinomycetota bacterium]
MTADRGTSTPTPLFICGYQKSGTSLAAALMDGHPRVCVFPEETSILRWMAGREFASRQDALRFLLERTHVERLGHVLDEGGPEGNRDFRDFDHPRFRRELEERFLAGDGSARSLLDAVMVAFADASGQAGREYWVEKTPRNEYYLDTIDRWYPGARALFMVRDPRDVYVSYSRNRELGGATLGLGNFVATWGLSVWNWKRQPAGDRRLLLRYEDLLRDPEAELLRVCTWLGIEFSDDVTRPTKLGKAWYGNSMFDQQFEGISTRPIGRWRDTLDRQDLEVIEALLGREMQEFGYELSGTRPTAVRKVRSWLRCAPQRRPVAGVLRKLARLPAPARVASP